jgi:hypothetical protein
MRLSFGHGKGASFADKTIILAFRGQASSGCAIFAPAPWIANGRADRDGDRTKAFMKKAHDRAGQLSKLAPKARESGGGFVTIAYLLRATPPMIVGAPPPSCSDEGI